MSQDDSDASDHPATDVEPVSDAEESESTDDVDAVTTDVENDAWPDVEDDTTSRAGRGASRLGWLAPVTLAVLLVTSLAVAGWLYFFWYRADQQVGDAAQQSALSAAADGVVAVLTYSPDTLDKDFANAKRYLTGDFLNYYTDYTQRIVTPAAKEKSVKTSAAVIRKSLVEIQPDRAEVLLFINQSTTSKSMPDGSYSTSAVRIGLQRHGGAWLISSFDPV